MAKKYLHEEIFRGPAAMEQLATLRITLCGAGALGSMMADNLVRQGFRSLRVIDFDRIEEHNVGTQTYDVADVGAKKVDVLKNRLFRATEVEIEMESKELTDRTAKALLKKSDVVIDTFDNSKSRQLVQDYCRNANLECLHIGLFADYCEAIWDEYYKVPRDAAGDVCEYPLARNLVLLAVSIASELLVRFALDGTKQAFSATLADFAVTELEI